MNLQQHGERLKQLAAKTSAQATLSIRVPAANRLRGSVINRIANDGKASDGSKIGSYSTKPAYFSRNQFAKKGAFKPQGKIRTGTKTMYIPTGYSGFRAIQGRKTDTVNLQLSGDLLLDYQQEERGAEILIGFTNKLQSDKRRGNEKRFGKNIFRATQQEVAAYNKECAEGYNKIIVNTLRG